MCIYSFTLPARRIEAIISKMPISTEMRNNIIIARGIITRLCEQFQELQKVNSLAEIFKNSSLKKLAQTLDTIPDFIRIVIQSIIQEDLHQFLVANQLPDLIADFPRAFCDLNREDNFFEFLNESSTAMKVSTAEVKNVMESLCTTNWTQVVDDILLEMIPKSIYEEMANPNSSLHLDQFVNASHCILEMSLGMNWTKFVNIGAIEDIFQPHLNIQ